MTDQDKADLMRLMGDKAFLAFLYRTIQRGGVFSTTTTGTDGRDLSFSEGRRSMAIDMLNEIEAAQAVKSPDGLPVFGSIQILVGFAQSVAKENTLGRRSGIYNELDDGNGS